MTQKKKPGRPKGSKQQSVTVEVLVIPTQCPKCGSDQRSNYDNVRTLDYAGKLNDGREYTSISWKCCYCLDCKQRRIDKHYKAKP